MNDFASPAARLRALIKLRGALDNRVTLEWVAGRVYGVVGAERAPLFTLNAVAFAQYKQTGDNTFTGRRVEVVFHGDLETGERINSFLNPYTGAVVPIPEQRTPLALFEVGTDGLRLPAQMGPMAIATESEIGEPLVQNGRLWLRLDTRNRFMLPDGKVVSHYAESMVYTGAAEAVSDPEQLAVKADISYTNVMSWRPWMAMGAQQGHTLSSAHGEKVESLQAVPDYLQRFVKAEHPDLADDPAAVLNASPRHGAG
ncbi:MAG: DUF1838 family protein [Gammaproteobacteria bacterium]|nr:DUF1838 family protein [Gammaproteobacteria bacterium]